MSRTNHGFKLAARPVGLPGRDDWEYFSEEVGDPGEGQILIEVSHISLDPAMRGWVREGRSYVPPVEVGAVMRALGIGRVIASGALPTSPRATPSAASSECSST